MNQYTITDKMWLATLLSMSVNPFVLPYWTYYAFRYPEKAEQTIRDAVEYRAEKKRKEREKEKELIKEAMAEYYSEERHQND